MPPRLRLLRFLRRWHARLGFTAALFVLLLAASGIALNHGAALGFDGTYLHAAWLARWYGMASDAPSREFRSARHSLVAANGRWLLDGRALGEHRPEPLGLVELRGDLAIAGEAAIWLYGARGELIDRLDSLALPAIPLQAIGERAGTLVVRTRRGVFVTPDALAWQPGSGAGVAWSQPRSLSAAERRHYAEKLLPGIALQRVLLDVHSGRFLGRFGPFAFDGVALALIVLALSGGWVFLAPRLRRH